MSPLWNNTRFSTPWGAWICVALGVFMATLDTSIVNISLPTIAHSLKTDLPSTEWVVLAYMLGLASILIPVGRLSDIWGRRPMFVIGILIFTAGSFLCGIASSVSVMIFSRLIQAIGAAGVLASGPAIISEMFQTDRGKVLGLIGSVVSLGTMAGPSLGGWIVESLGWPWIFWVNVPVGLLTALYSWQALTVLKRPQDVTMSFDILGTLFSITGLSCLMLLLTYGLQLTWQHPVVLALAGLLVFCSIGFIYQERRSPSPLLDFSIFKERLYTNACVASFLSFVGITAIFFLVPFYLQVIRHYSPAFSGWVMIVSPLALALFGPISGALSDRMGSRNLAMTGMLVSSIGLGITAMFTAQTPLWQILLGTLLVGGGNGLFHAPNSNQMLSSIDSRHLGIAGGMLAIVRTLGMMTAVTLAGFVFALHNVHFTSTTGFLPAFHSVFVWCMGLTLLNVFWIGWYRTPRQRAAHPPNPA